MLNQLPDMSIDKGVLQVRYVHPPFRSVNSPVFVVQNQQLMVRVTSRVHGFELGMRLEKTFRGKDVVNSRLDCSNKSVPVKGLVWSSILEHMSSVNVIFQNFFGSTRIVT